MIRNILIKAIKFYQRYISPLKKPSCRFYPTCSQYSIDAISLYGPIKGCFLAFKRILKCNPFHPGGYDPIKKEKEQR